MSVMIDIKKTLIAIGAISAITVVEPASTAPIIAQIANAISAVDIKKGTVRSKFERIMVKVVEEVFTEETGLDYYEDIYEEIIEKCFSITLVEKYLLSETPIDILAKKIKCVVQKKLEEDIINQIDFCKIAGNILSSIRNKIHNDSELQDLEHQIFTRDIHNLLTNSINGQEEIKNLLITLIDEQRTDKKLREETPGKKRILFTHTKPPFSREEIIGREDFVKILHTYLKKGNSVIIYAVGGMGKTEIACLYAKKYCNYYDYIGYIVWPNEKTNRNAFTDVLIRCTGADTVESQPNQQYTAALEHLAKFGNDDTKKLLIIDNVPENLTDQEEGDVWPSIASDLRQLGFPILVCARAAYSQFKYIEVPSLSDDNCRRLFEKYWNHELDYQDMEKWQKILNRSGRHTLIIELMGRLLELNGENVSWLLYQLENKGFDLSNRYVQAKLYEKGLNATLSRHIGFLFSMQKVQSESEKTVLLNLCVFPAMKINMKTWCEWMGGDSDEILANAVYSLEKRGWIRRQGQIIWIHPLVADIVWRDLKPNLLDCTTMVTGLIDSMYVNIEKGEHSNKKRELIPFALEILNRFKNNKTIQYAQLCKQIGWYFFSLRNDSTAILWYEKARKIQEKVLDKMDFDMADLYNKIALPYRREGKINKSREYHRKSLDICLNTVNRKYSKKAQKECKKGIAKSYNNLAWTYLHTNRNNIGWLYSNEKLPLTYESIITALYLFKKALAINKKELKPHDPDIATNYNNIAVTYYYLDKYEKSLLYHERARNIRKDVLTDDHPELARTFMNMGDLYKAKKNFNLALNNYQDALRIYEINYPQMEQIDKTIAYNRLGNLYETYKYYSLAENYYEKELGAKEKLFGKNHEDTLKNYNHLSKLYKKHILQILYEILEIHAK